MRVLFSADLHIKVGQKNVPRDWQRSRFESLFKKYAETYAEKKCQLFILGGDIFDKLPNMEELELYFSLLSQIRENSMRTVIYPGNHEAVKKNTTFLSNLKSITKEATLGYARVIDDYETIDGIIDVLPYNRLKEYHPGSIDFHSRILCTHVRGEIPPHVLPEVPLELFDRWDVVLAGDLHSYENCQRNILYPGSPVTTSFHRNDTKNGVIILDTDSLRHEFVEYDLPKLFKKTVESADEMVKTDFHHTIYELEGDLADMTKKVNSDLLDKKVIRKESKSSLNLTSNMPVKEELSIYLTEIMKLEPAKVSKALSLYDDHIRETDME